MLPIAKQSKTPSKAPPKRGGLVTIFKSLTRVNPAVDKDYMTVSPSEYKIRFTKDWVERAANIPKEFLSDPIEGSETVISVQDSEEDSFQNDHIPELHHPAFNHGESSDEENESKAVIMKHFRKLPKSPKSSSSETDSIIVQPALVGKHSGHLLHSPEVVKLLDPVQQLQPIIVDPKEKSPQKNSSSASKPKIPPRKERPSASQQLFNKASQRKQKNSKNRKYKNQGRVSRLTVADQNSKTRTRPKSKLKRFSKPKRDRSVGNNSRSARAEIPQKGHKPNKLTKGKRSRKKFLKIKSSISKFKGPSGKLRKPKGRLSKEKKRIKKKGDSLSKISLVVSSDVTVNKRPVSGNEDNSDSYNSSKSELKALNYNPVKGGEELVVRLYHHELTSASDSSSPDGLKERPSGQKHAIKKPKSILRQTLYYGKLPSHPAPNKKITPTLDMADNQGDALHVKEQNVTHVEGKDESPKASLHELEKQKVPEEFETDEIRRDHLPLDGMTIEYEDGFRSPKGWTQNDLFSNDTFPEGKVFLNKAKPSLARNPRLNWKNKPKPAILFFQSKTMPQRRSLLLKSVQLTPLEQKLRSYYEENDTDAEGEKNNRFDVQIFSSYTGSTLEFKRHKMSELTLPSESRSEGRAVSKRESVLHPNPPENSRMSSDN